MAKNFSGALVKLKSLTTTKIQVSNTIRVAILYDAPHWAWHRKGLILQKLLADQNVEIVLYRENVAFDFEAFNFIVVFDAFMLNRMVNMPPPDKVLLGCSNDKLLKQTEEAYIDGKCRAIFINTEFGFNQLKHLENVYLCQNGVDVELFRPPSKLPTKRRALWIGNSRGVAEKGVCLIQDACSRAGIPLTVLDRSSNLLSMISPFHKIKSSKTLVKKYYSKATVYLCGSRFEGTPNPALEALACGVPVISTKVGNMPELIVDGWNGFLVSRTVDDFVRALNAIQLQDQAMLSHNARVSITQEWSWNNRAQAYLSMFRAMKVLLDR